MFYNSHLYTVIFLRSADNNISYLCTSEWMCVRVYASTNEKRVRAFHPIQYNTICVYIVCCFDSFVIGVQSNQMFLLYVDGMHTQTRFFVKATSLSPTSLDLTCTHTHFAFVLVLYYFWKKTKFDRTIAIRSNTHISIRFKEGHPKCRHDRNVAMIETFWSFSLMLSGMHTHTHTLCAAQFYCKLLGLRKWHFLPQWTQCYVKQQENEEEKLQSLNEWLQNANFKS